MGKLSTRQVYAPAVKHQIATPSTVTIFLDGLYHAVDWENGVYVGGNAVLSTTTANALTYINGLGGGIIFFCLRGTHTITVTVAVNVANVQFMGLGKVTVLQVNDAAPQSLFQVNAVGVSFYNIAFDGFYTVGVAEVDGITWLANSRRGLISGCYFFNWGVGANNHATEVLYNSAAAHIIVASCHFLNCTGYTVAFASAGGHCVAVGNIVISSPGFETDNGDANVISGNVFHHSVWTAGIMMNAPGYNNIAVGNTLIYSYMQISSENAVITGNSFNNGRVMDAGVNNVVTGNSFLSGTVAVSITGSYTTVTGNSFDQVTTAVYLDGADDVTISGNTIIALGQGVWLAAGSYRIVITGNRINAVSYGVYFTSPDTSAAIRDNDFTGCPSPVYFTAANRPADLLLDAVTVQLVQYGGGSAGWTAPVIVTSPGGIDIDADNEFAYAHATLPLKVQRVVRIKIWAYSNVAEAVNNMLLRIVVNGGGSSEAWNTEPVNVINHPSEETGGIAVGDVIHWVIDRYHDADINDLRGGDHLEIMAVGEAAAAPDIATDGLFGVVEIEYV